MTAHPEPLPQRQPQAPPTVQTKYRREGLHLSADPGGRLRPLAAPAPWWKSQRVWVIGGAVAVSAVITMVAFASSRRAGGEDGTYVAQEEPIDRAAVLAVPNENAELQYRSAHAIVDELTDGVLHNEAWYYLGEADKAIAKEGEPCFRKTRICALNQFALDAEAMLEAAKQAGDNQQIALALLRFNAVEAARDLKSPPVDLPIFTAKAAMQSIVQFHQRQDALSVESKAYELNSDSE